MDTKKIELIGDNHEIFSLDTPLREDAFVKSNDEKIKNIEKHFTKIIDELGLDLNDDSISGTPYRVAKMYVKEIFSGLDPENKPRISLFDNKYNYNKMLIEKNIDLNSTCEHHFLPITGTIEFLVDVNKNFYFMEMNTRIQVEHGITEEVTDYDLIKEQIKVADGVKVSGEHYYPKLHSIECRINAEDPSSNFRPSPGKITALHKPGGHGVRVDSHIYSGYVIPPNYDSMIAKLIVSHQSRDEAIVRMKRALKEFIIEGIETTIPFHIKIMNDKNFVKGNFTTKFMDTFKY